MALPACTGPPSVGIVEAARALLGREGAHLQLGLLAPYAINKQETAKQALPSSLSFLGPYLSMTMPRGRVMALSRKEPTVKAKFRISSWALQLSQPFIQLTSSCSGTVVPPIVALEMFSGSVHR